MTLRIVRPACLVVAARKREIAARYARRNRKKFGPLSFAAIRASELTRLYKYRWHCERLPDDDDGVLAARIMAYHLAKLRDAPRRISRWLDRWAPWLDLVSHERIITDAIECPLRYRADKLAWKLKVTAVERDQCALRTIGAIDQSPAERKAAAAARKLRATARRRANGAKPRAEYEAASLTKLKPWIAAGMSRTAWYARHSGQV